MSSGRDRHGRASRSNNDRRRRPSDGFRTRNASRFRQLVEEAVDSLPERLAAPLENADLVVAAVPPPGATAPDGSVLLAAFAGSRLTVYRRPLEAQAVSHGDLEETLRVAVGQAVARGLGVDDDPDDLFEDE